jgi:hypothetical protein
MKVTAQRPVRSDIFKRSRQHLIHGFAVTAVLLVASVVLSMASALPASAATSCASSTRTYYLSDGSISLRVGWIRINVIACSDGRSLVSSSASTESGETGPGKSTGWEVHFAAPYLTSSTPSAANYQANGSLRECLYYHAPICSRSEGFRMTGQLRDVTGAIGPVAYEIRVAGRRYATLYGAVNTTSGGRIRFNNTI